MVLNVLTILISQVNRTSDDCGLALCTFTLDGNRPAVDLLISHGTRWARSSVRK